MTPLTAPAAGASLVRALAPLALAVAPHTLAAQAREDAASSRGALQVTPYVWASGLSGTIQPSASAPWVVVRRGARELLEDLDGAFFVSAFARRERWVAVADVSVASTSRAGLVPTGNPALPAVGAEARLRQTSATLAAGYRVVEGPGGALDLLAGARAWWLRPSLTAPPLTSGVSAAVDVVDPIVAARGTIVLAPGATVLAYGDVGGVRAGSPSTRQLVLTANARVARRIWISGGYRVLTVDRERRGARVDASLHGPLFGGTLTF